MDKQKLKQKLKKPVYFTKKTGSIKGKPFSFKGRPHLEAVYNDKHPRVVIVAGRQTEKSESVVRKMIFHGYTRPYTTITYTSPRFEQVTRFQNDRFRAAIRDSAKAILESSVDKKRDAKTAMGLLNRTVYYFGSAWSDGDSLRGIAGDMVFFDEVQDIAQAAVETIEKSISHSDIHDTETELNGRCFYTGTPKEKGSYYDRVLWGMSDQKKWHVTCDKCDHVQTLSMDNIMDRPGSTESAPKKYFGCFNCAAELNRENGEWIAMKPENTLYSAYHFTQLIMPWISANQIYRDSQTMDAETFHNEVLGEFYAGNKKPITYELVLANTDRSRSMIQAVPRDHIARVMGIDYGSGGKSKTIITIGHDRNGELIVDYIENCQISDHQELVAHIMKLKERFNVDKVVGDLGYASFEHELLHKRYGREAMAIQYVSFSSNPSKQDFADKNVLKVDRTHSMDKLIDLFHKHKIKLPYKQPEQVEWAFDHYTAIETVYTESKTSSGKKLYDHKTPDDAFHSLNYLRIGIEMQSRRFAAEGIRRNSWEADVSETGASSLEEFLGF